MDSSLCCSCNCVLPLAVGFGEAASIGSKVQLSTRQDSKECLYWSSYR